MDYCHRLILCNTGNLPVHWYQLMIIKLKPILNVENGVFKTRHQGGVAGCCVGCSRFSHSCRTMLSYLFNIVCDIALSVCHVTSSSGSGYDVVITEPVHTAEIDSE